MLRRCSSRRRASWCIRRTQRHLFTGRVGCGYAAHWCSCCASPCATCGSEFVPGRFPGRCGEPSTANWAALSPWRVRLHPDGPAALWAPRSLLLLPPDFLGRFDPAEQRLILRHEMTHLRRFDPLWSLLAELGCALLWFHPLAWLALPRLRLDQELACDERVLREAPQNETRYARTLMQSAGIAMTPVLIPWLAEPQLKERLQMINRHCPGALRRRIGVMALGLLMAGSAMAAQSAMSGHDTHRDKGITEHVRFTIRRRSIRRMPSGKSSKARSF